MKPDKPFILFLFLICLSGRLAAQSPFPFGTTSMSDMEMTEYDQDKDAPAVYLFDWCSATLSANNDLSLTVQKHFRIKILKQEGLDYALLKIQFSGSHPPTKLKASTFNLEDGKMVESPVNKKEMFTEKYGNYNRLSLAFNNVKIGSVIECSYTISYDSYFFFYPWSFQHDIPVAYSEYNASFPGLFRYKIEGHYDNINVSLHQDKRPAYYGSLSTQELIYKWTAGNVPAFKPEPYMASENDLISRVEFELAGVDIPGYGYQEATPTYEKLTKELLEDDNFGGIMQKSEFLREITNKITSGLTDNLSKIKAIHRYITQNVKWNEENRIYATATSFRRILKQQNGSSADINLLFTAMLQKAGITSCPVVLSTRENGNLNHYFAMISRLDYVVAYAKIEGKGGILCSHEYLLNRNMRCQSELCFAADGRIPAARKRMHLLGDGRWTHGSPTAARPAARCAVSGVIPGWSAVPSWRVRRRAGGLSASARWCRGAGAAFARRGSPWAEWWLPSRRWSSRGPGRE
jgi:transglutaminase-like putative cysteine protease